MQKPWPLFSCSPQCGIVNWIYVKDGKMFPINRFVNFDKFFNYIRKTAENVESKGKMAMLSSLFMGAMLSMRMLTVTKEVGTFTLMGSIIKMHMSPSYQSLGKIRRRIFLLGCMAFMDNYNFDVNRVRRCVVHYIHLTRKLFPSVLTTTFTEYKLKTPTLNANNKTNKKSKFPLKRTLPLHQYVIYNNCWCHWGYSLHLILQV